MPTATPVGNRKRVRGTDNRIYWYNEQTGRLFRSPQGNDEVLNFRYDQRSGVVQILGSEQQPNPNFPGNTPEEPGSVMPPPPRPPDDELPIDDPCPPGYHLSNENGSWTCVADEDSFDEDFFQDLIGDLEEWGLGGLTEWVRQAIIEGKSYTQILRELRETDEYKAEFPEQEMRKKNGLTMMPEAEIFAYRDRARGLLREIYGWEGLVSDEQISSLIGTGKSLDEFAHDLQVWKTVQDRGPEVKMLFETILGVNLSDDDMRELFDPEISTPELNRAFEDALYRGLPAMLGLGIRPEEEAEKLRAFGIDPDKAFAGYQEVAGQLPLFTKLEAINNALRGEENLPTGNEFLNETPLMDLIAGIQFRDPQALARLSNTLAQEGARWRTGGRALQGRQGELIGLAQRGS